MEDLDQAAIDAQIEACRVAEARAKACKGAVPQAEPNPEDLLDTGPQDVIEAQNADQKFLSIHADLNLSQD
ncbi:hypothetical protein PIB30_093748 [Stylosanthes scabra]|uniref:Uncharacterized protein n=1 Tax=Stylosanthes scabra TaxID=79078 RepID=A0ABU6QUL1_9FABA|nr:hypothetical protein [Stylosanthes scabra]